MKIFRTPDAAFASLPHFDYEPNYAEVPHLGPESPVGADQNLEDGQVADSGTLRMAYLDVGPKDANPVLLLHGEPSWSFLYRKIIPPLLAQGHRVIAPDLIGFGRSDKPADVADYTYSGHAAWLSHLLFTHLDLRNITLFCQDWGGLLGLRIVSSNVDRFDRVIASNTFLPTGSHPGDAFMAWREFALTSESFPIGRIVSGGCVTPLSDDVIAAYDAPFPDTRFTAGARAFPALVPLSHDDPEALINLDAWKRLSAFDKPFLCAFGDSDMVSGGGHVAMVERIAGASGQPHTILEGGGHFIQEDCGPRLADIINAFVTSTT